MTVPEPGGVTAVQVSATVPPAAGRAEEIVGAESFGSPAVALPAPVVVKYATALPQSTMIRMAATTTPAIPAGMTRLIRARSP